MMLDDNIVAVSPRTSRPPDVYRVLKAAGLLEKWQRTPSKKGTGFHQPLKAHEHWHMDIAYINVCGTFYYLCSLLDGYSRFIVHWEIRIAMKETDIEIIIQRARELFPGTAPRIISDNGPQFIAREFKEFITLCGMTGTRSLMSGLLLIIPRVTVNWNGIIARLNPKRFVSIPRTLNNKL